MVSDFQMAMDRNSSEISWIGMTVRPVPPDLEIDSVKTVMPIPQETKPRIPAVLKAS